VRGKCKWWNRDRGFGFLLGDDSSKDTFVHVTGLAGGEKELFPEDRVEFDVEQNPRTGKLQACRVRVL
jgi:CspA family cold shock protein